jgi:hypothetical protein
MPSISYIMAVGRVETGEKAVESLEQDPLLVEHRNANFACDVEMLAVEVADIIAAVGRSAEQCGEGIAPATTQAQIALAHQIGALFTRCLELIGKVLKLIDVSAGMGRPIKRDDLIIARHDVTKRKAEFAKRWSVPDEDSIRLSRQQIADGKFIVL